MINIRCPPSNINDALTLFNNLLYQTKYRIWAPTMTIGNHQSDAARFRTRPNMLFVGVGVLVFALIFMTSRQFDKQQSQLYAMSSHVAAAELSDQLADVIENGLIRILSLFGPWQHIKKPTIPSHNKNF